MIPTLYEPFKKWSKSGSVWIISDTHFSDDDCKLMDINWLDPQEHINLIKKYVHKNDTLIHLGDVGDTNWIKQIKAYKVLIMGNHDSGASNYMHKYIQSDLDGYTEKEIEEKLRCGEIEGCTYSFHKPFVQGFKSNSLFNEVYTGPVFIAEKLLLSHEPIVSSDGLWYNIHGHDHNADNYKPFANKDGFADLWNELNLASNVVNYKPYNLGAGIKNGLLSCVDGIHRKTIDDATNKHKTF